MDAAAKTTFAPGDLVAARYRIVRFLDRGGVGEVYEADDEVLRSRVALKTLRERANATLLERFKREINLARQIAHPNVCRLYEFGQHRKNDDDVFFLTMELLAGETLHARIRTRGTLTPREALPLVVQMAAGLGAAHRVGVVHRDFKAGNVILVAEAAGAARAVITDFGLARPTQGDQLELTAHDTLVGTPAYMAPEQVQGGAITPATDVYALGVVIFEMLTGRYPYDGESNLANAIRRLTEPPSSPRIYRPDIDRRWEAAILRCLEREPARRFPSAEAVAAALEGPRAVGGSRSQIGLAALAAVLAAGLAAAWWWTRGPASLPAAGTGVALPAAGAQVVPRRSIALLGFRNLSGREDVAWLSTALAEMLSIEIAAGEHLRVIPGEQVARTRTELGFEPGDELAAGTVARIGEILGTDLVVAGSYMVAGSREAPEIRLDVQVRQASSGEVVAVSSDRAAIADVLDLIDALGRGLRDQLGVAALTDAEARAVRASQPEGAEATRLYAEGLAHLRLFDAQAALEPLQAAAGKDPENPLIHSALAAAWDALGYTPRAVEAAHRAFELSSELPERDRRWVEAQYYESAGMREDALATYRKLWQALPDDLEHGLRLAEAQISAGKAEEALATVEQLRRLSAVANPRIDLVEAEAARALAQYARQQEKAADAARKAEELGARLLVARGREIEAGAWRDLGEPEKALAAYQVAREIYAAANHRGPVARILIAEAQVLRYQARFDEARTLIDEALEVSRAIGDQGAVKRAFNTLAVMLREEGKLSEALEMHERELDTQRTIGDRHGEPVTLTSIGVVEEMMGDLHGAQRRFEEALALGRESGNLRSVEINLNLLGEVLLHRGRVAEASSHFEEALEHNARTGSPRGRAYYLAALGEVDRIEDRLGDARRRQEEALAIRREIRERTNIAYSLLWLAGVAIEEGRFEEAASGAAEADAEFAAENKPDARGLALATLARARLGQGRLAEAQAKVVEAQSLLAGSEIRFSRMTVDLRSAEILAARGDREAAAKALRTLVVEARELDFVDVELEAETLLARLEGSPERRAAIARRARVQGFLLLARQTLP